MLQKTIIAACLLALTLLGRGALAQGLVVFPSTSYHPRYPYSLWVDNDSKVVRTVELRDVYAHLQPVTPDMGRASGARLIFAPGVLMFVKLAPFKRAVYPFRLDTPAPQGVYVLELSVTGQPLTERNPPGFQGGYDYPLAYVLGLHVPHVYRVGQRFLYLGSNGLRNPSKDYRRDSRPLRHRQVYGRIFTLTGHSKERATFHVEGVGRVTLRSASTDFPSLAPILDYPRLATARRAYGGRRVWRYGGSEPNCRPTDGSIGFRTAPIPLHVRRVLRVAWPSGLNLAGGYGYGGYAASFQGDVMTGTPLVVQSELAKFGARLQRCQTTELFADAWQLERTYSLTPPPPGLKARSRLVGLTRYQYAWREGFPSSIFGTKARLLTLNTWKYDSIPFPITVTFRNGRAVKRDVPRLP